MNPPSADLSLIARAREHAERTAVVAPEGTFTYAELLDASARVAAALLDGRIWHGRKVVRGLLYCLITTGEGMAGHSFSPPRYVLPGYY